MNAYIFQIHNDSKYIYFRKYILFFIKLQMKLKDSVTTTLLI